MSDIASIAQGVRDGAVDPLEPATEAVSRLHDHNEGPSGLNAFLAALSTEDVAALESVASGGRLSGVPVAVKDNMATVGFPTTCGSKILEGYQAPYEATVVRRLREEGAVIVGKTNLDEFAMGSSTENSAYGPVRNPCDPLRVPGGSSGGSAAAVASGIVPGALGSDTGGSVRQPASFCGVVGMKPTYGRVSRYGLVAFASSLDQVGMFGATVADATELLQTVAGHDPRDSTSVDRPVPDFSEERDIGAEGLEVGVPSEYFGDALEPGVKAACQRALDLLEANGARIREVSLPNTAYALSAYYVIATAEASSNLARFDGVRYGLRDSSGEDLGEMYERTRTAGFGREDKKRKIIGTFAETAG